MLNQTNQSSSGGILLCVSGVVNGACLQTAGAGFNHAITS